MACDLGSSTAMTRSACPAGEQSLGQDLDGHRRRPLTHADEHGAVAEDVDVATFDRCRQVVLVIVAVVDDRVLVGEEGVEPVDGPAVQRLALACRLRHGVDRHAAVDPARVVPLEQMVRQRREQEVVGPQRRPLQAVHAPGMEIGLEDSSDQVPGQRRAVGVLEELAQRVDEGRARPSRGCTPGRARTPGPSAISSVSASSWA